MALDEITATATQDNIASRYLLDFLKETLLYTKKVHYSHHMGFLYNTISLRQYTLSLALIVLVALFFTACGHSRTTVCQELDWYEIGRQDGQNPDGPNARRAIAPICSESDPSLSEALYNNGFDSGVSSLCTPKNGFEMGQKNDRKVISLCPPMLRADFERAFNQGRRLKDIEREQLQIQARINAIDNSLKDSAMDIARRGLMSGEKIQLTSKNNDLENEISSIKESNSF